MTKAMEEARAILKDINVHPITHAPRILDRIATALAARDAEIERLRMHLGEMTAQELRTARAAIRLANSALPALEATPPAVSDEWFNPSNAVFKKTVASTTPAPKVTEVMVEAASREYMRIFDKHLLSKHARLILTAAQEAGKP